MQIRSTGKEKRILGRIQKLILHRIGYKSSGGFSIPQCEPLAFLTTQPPPAAAYYLSFSASNVDKKNPIASAAGLYIKKMGMQHT